MVWNVLNNICYSNRPQDLSKNWSPHMPINDLNKASATFPKKAVASVWDTDAPCVCWADFRDGNGDYDTYADFPENKGLASDSFKIICSTGGSVNMTLDAGVSNMHRYSLIFGSASGVAPGTYLPGGALLPLNWDVFTNMVINLTNTPIFHNFYGKHDSKGKRTAKFNIPPYAGAPSININFAFAMMGPWNYASNPITIKIMP